MREHFFWKVGLVYAKYCPASRGDGDDSDVFEKILGRRAGRQGRKGETKPVA
jgi:hypothetical protein